MTTSCPCPFVLSNLPYHVLVLFLIFIEQLGLYPLHFVVLQGFEVRAWVSTDRKVQDEHSTYFSVHVRSGLVVVGAQHLFFLVQLIETLAQALKLFSFLHPLFVLRTLWNIRKRERARAKLFDSMATERLQDGQLPSHSLWPGWSFQAGWAFVHIFSNQTTKIWLNQDYSRSCRKIADF